MPSYFEAIQGGRLLLEKNLFVTPPVLYTVALQATFGNINSAIWAVGQLQGIKRKISEMTEFLLKYATFWGSFFNFFVAKNFSKFFFATKKLKKPPQKVAYLSRNSVVTEIFHLLPTYCPTAQMAEFMFPNVAYRATVYRTGG